MSISSVLRWTSLTERRALLCYLSLQAWRPKLKINSPRRSSKGDAMWCLWACVGRRDQSLRQVERRLFPTHLSYLGGTLIKKRGRRHASSWQQLLPKLIWIMSDKGRCWLRHLAPEVWNKHSWAACQKSTLGSLLQMSRLRTSQSAGR